MALTLLAGFAACGRSGEDSVDADTAPGSVAVFEGGPVQVLRTLPVKAEPLRYTAVYSRASSRSETASSYSICAISRTAPVSAEVVIAA